MKIPFFIRDYIHTLLLRKVFLKRKPDLVIGDDQLHRWYVIPRNKWFNIYFHIFYKSDTDDALHDHPWWSLSFILHNGYSELYLDKNGSVKERSIDAGQVILRRPEYAHAVLIKDPLKAAHTLFITGRTVRTWGFLCKGGWRSWEKYRSLKPDGSKWRCD